MIDTTLRIAYATVGDASDVSTWSGTPLHMARAMQDSLTEIELIGPLKERSRMMGRLKRRCYGAFGLAYHHYRNSQVARDYARQVRQRLDLDAPSVILAPSAIPVAFLKTELPIVVWADATFASLVGYYPSCRRLAKETLRDGYSMETEIFRRAAAMIFSSEWAADSALRTYGSDSAPVHVVPYGANLEGPRDAGAVRRIIRSRARSECRLIFIGADWARKGGDDAVAIARRLNERGLRTTLTVVGGRPMTPRPLPDFVQLEGYVSQVSEAGRETIRTLLERSHFLLLPTRAEAYGVVFAEASSHGVPSLASNTGGVPTAIRPGRNGELFEIGDVEAYCECVERLFGAYDDEYVKLAETSFAEASERLNWSASASAVRRILRSVAV